MGGAECLTWGAIVGAFALSIWLVRGLANPKPNRFDDDLDEWDYIAMIDDMEHGDE